jgi:hypothetical protein
MCRRCRCRGEGEGRLLPRRLWQATGHVAAQDMMWLLKYLRFVAGQGQAPPGSELMTDREAEDEAEAKRAAAAAGGAKKGRISVMGGGKGGRILGSMRKGVQPPSPLSVHIPAGGMGWGAGPSSSPSPSASATSPSSYSPSSPGSPQQRSHHQSGRLTQHQRAVLSWMAACGVPITDPRGILPAHGVVGALKDGKMKATYHEWS